MRKTDADEETAMHVMNACCIAPKRFSRGSRIAVAIVTVSLSLFADSTVAVESEPKESRPSASSEEEAPAPIKTPWGEIRRESGESDIYRFDVTAAPDDRRLDIPTPFAHVIECVAVQEDFGAAPRFAEWEFNSEATRMQVLLPTADDAGKVGAWRVHTAENSKQSPDGRVLFSALDAQVHGTSAKLETHPGNHRVGFWTNADDFVTWDFQATRWGMYEVRMTYSTASPDGTEIEVVVDGNPLRTKLRSTGSWYRYRTISLGRVYVAESGECPVKVRCVSKVGGAVMNLKSISLHPACEGDRPKQADDGTITLHGRDSTVHGTMLRYEPNEKKLTLGYWVRAEDSASWDFSATKAGKYDVEVTQGCGKGQGGSGMLIQLGGGSLEFTVEDTGHFQNFKPRVIGRVEIAAGIHRLTIQPKSIAKQAAADIPQIKLVPVTP